MSQSDIPQLELQNCNKYNFSYSRRNLRSYSNQNGQLPQNNKNSQYYGDMVSDKENIDPNQSNKIIDQDYAFINNNNQNFNKKEKNGAHIKINSLLQLGGRERQIIYQNPDMNDIIQQYAQQQQSNQIYTPSFSENMIQNKNKQKENLQQQSYMHKGYDHQFYNDRLNCNQYEDNTIIEHNDKKDDYSKRLKDSIQNQIRKQSSFKSTSQDFNLVSSSKKSKNSQSFFEDNSHSEQSEDRIWMDPLLQKKYSNFRIEGQDFLLTTGLNREQSNQNNYYITNGFNSSSHKRHIQNNKNSNNNNTKYPNREVQMNFIQKLTPKQMSHKKDFKNSHSTMTSFQFNTLKTDAELTFYKQNKDNQACEDTQIQSQKECQFTQKNSSYDIFADSHNTNNGYVWGQQQNSNEQEEDTINKQISHNKKSKHEDDENENDNYGHTYLYSNQAKFQKNNLVNKKVHKNRQQNGNKKQFPQEVSIFDCSDFQGQNQQKNYNFILNDYLNQISNKDKDSLQQNKKIRGEQLNLNQNYSSYWEPSVEIQKEGKKNKLNFFSNALSVKAEYSTEESVTLENENTLQEQIKGYNENNLNTCCNEQTNLSNCTNCQIF